MVFVACAYRVQAGGNESCIALRNMFTKKKEKQQKQGKGNRPATDTLDETGTPTLVRIRMGLHGGYCGNK